MLDTLIYLVLIVLMLTIGMNLGVNDSIVSNLGLIGFNCMIISLCEMCIRDSNHIVHIIICKTFLI